MALRAVGYFASQPGDRRPDVRQHIDSFWEASRRPRILIYLRAGAVFEASTLMGRCLLCPEPVGTRDLTDGVWLWPESLAHLVEKHTVRLPDEMVAHMAALNFRVPKVDVRMLKMAATGLLDQPRELVQTPGVQAPGFQAPPTTSPTTSERPPKRGPPPPVFARARVPAAGDLDDSTTALPLDASWVATVAGVSTITPAVAFTSPVVVGRDESSAEIVVGHGSISRRHCRLVPGPHSVIVQDLDSQNGVLVQGRKVAQAELRDGDTFTIGPATITIKRPQA